MSQTTTMSEFNKTMVDILGRDAFYSTDFKVTDNVIVLARTVNYLFSQLSQCKNMMAEDDKHYVDDVKKSAIEILKGEGS